MAAGKNNKPTKRNIDPGAQRGEEPKKVSAPWITDELDGLDEEERKRLERLMRFTRFYKKKEKKQRRDLPRLISLVRNSGERREYEDKFAHNVTVTSKHERRRRWKLRWRVYTFLITGGIILLLAGYIIFSYILVIDKIDVVGTDRYLPEDIIAVTGIEPGMRLFSPSIDAKAAEEEITDKFSYIKSVEIKRELPDRIILNVTEEEPVFVSVIHDKYVLISRELRVLDIRTDKPVGHYIKLRLTGVTGALLGKQLSFEGDLFGVVQKAAAAVCSEEMREGTSVLDISDRFNISISYGGRFKLELGVINDIDIKLKLAFRIMEEDIFADGNKGTIYLDNVNKPSAIIDNEIDLD